MLDFVDCREHRSKASCGHPAVSILLCCGLPQGCQHVSNQEDAGQQLQVDEQRGKASHTAASRSVNIKMRFCSLPGECRRWCIVRCSACKEICYTRRQRMQMLCWQT